MLTIAGGIIIAVILLPFVVMGLILAGMALLAVPLAILAAILDFLAWLLTPFRAIWKWHQAKRNHKVKP